MKPTTLLSPAKINLTLDVFTKKFGDTFHEIETIYHLLDWGDEMEISQSDVFILEGDFDCEMEDNLIYKAWELMKKSKARALSSNAFVEPGLKDFPPVKVSVQKNIPTGSGLGGGSSNAAAFVKAYFEFFDLGLVPDKLIQKLGNLGKDIPFFFHKQPCAFGQHFGEMIRPVDFNFSGQEIYLYFPPFKSNTAQAYKSLKTFDTHYTQEFLKEPKLKNCNNIFKTIFEQKIYSELDSSGSGSTFFYFEKLDIPDCKIVKTKFL